MTNLPNPIYYDGVPYCRSQCYLFCGTETDRGCRFGFRGEGDTCDAAEMIADLVEKSRRTCETCDRLRDDARCPDAYRNLAPDGCCSEWEPRR